MPYPPTIDSGINPYYINAKDYGAALNEVNDDTNAIQAAINDAVARFSGGTVVLTGIGLVSAPITVPNNVTLMGVGQNSGLKISASFSGSQVILLNADFAQVRDMQIVGPTVTFGSNPAADAIRINGARRCIVDKIVFYYINGYMVNCTSTASVANYNTRITNLYGFNCANGIHLLGASGSSFGMSAFISDCSMDFQSGSGNCYLIEDSNDVLMKNIYGNYLGGSGTTLRIKGACNGVYVTCLDVGPFPNPGTTGPVVVIESSANGSPAYVGIANGIIEGGSVGALVSAGQQIAFVNCQFYNNANHGVQLTGGLGILVSFCLFYQNGAVAGAGRYDFTSSSGGNGEVRGCHFLSPQGSGAQQVNNVVNVTAGTIVMSDCTFYGTGFTSANIFAGKPSVIRNCPGYNPLGVITPPAVPASTVNTTPLPTDAVFYVKGGTLTDIKVNGVSTGISAAAPAGSAHAIRVSAQLPISVTYTVAPTWVVVSD